MQLFTGAGGATQIDRSKLTFTMTSVWWIQNGSFCNDGVTASPPYTPPSTYGLTCSSDSVADPQLKISYACSDGPVTKVAVWNRRVRRLCEA